MKTIPVYNDEYTSIVLLYIVLITRWTWFFFICKTWLTNTIKWLWILNWSKWILVVDILTQILLTILLSMDHSSMCKFESLHNSLHQRETVCGKFYIYIFFKIGKVTEVKRIRKICVTMSTTNICYSNSKFKVTCKKLQNLNTSTAGLIPKTNRL